LPGRLLSWQAPPQTMHIATYLLLWGMRYTSESGTSGMCHVLVPIRLQGRSHMSVQSRYCASSAISSLLAKRRPPKLMSAGCMLLYSCFNAK
jgi:hypothetical protein